MLKKIVVGFVSVVVSAYFTFLALDFVLAHLTARSARSEPQADRVVQNACSSDESFKFSAFQQMGGGLIRHPQLGWLLNPDTIGNVKGYLGDCVPYSKTPGTIRIVLLGDSFTGAIQVPYRETFASRLGELLSKRYPNKKIEVINLGIGGYGIDQQYSTLVNEGKKYHPDLVIQNVFLGNDIRDTSFLLNKSVEWPQHREHPIKPYFSLDSRENLITGKADLEYYYQMNLVQLLGRGPWRIKIARGTIRADLRLDPLVGVAPSGEAIDRIEFPTSKLFAVHLLHSNQTLNVESFGKKTMGGTIAGTHEAWSAEQEVPEEPVQPAPSKVRSHIALKNLRGFVWGRLLNNYTLARFLFERNWISTSDMPVFFLLGFQGNYPIDYRIFLENPGPEWEAAWNVAFRLLRETRKYAENNLKARYVTFTIPSMETVYPEYWRLALAAYPELRKIASEMDLTRPTRRMDAFLAKEGIAHLSFYDSMVKEFERNKALLYGMEHAHFNQDGHAFVAEKMAEFVIERELIAE